MIRLIKRKFHFVTIFLKHVTYYYSRDSISIIDPVIIVEALTGGCNKNQEEIHYATIQVPPVCPTDMSSSNLIKVQYYCRVCKHFEQRNPFFVFINRFKSYLGDWISRSIS